MAFENLFIRTTRFIGGIQLDAALNETHSNKLRITDNPIESGADITDHAIIEPDMVSIRAIVTDTPLGTAAFTELVDDVTGFFGTSTTENLTRSNAAYNALVELQRTREPLSIQTGLKLYNNMLIESINVSQGKDTSRSVFLNIVAKEVRITQTEVVQLEPREFDNEGNATSEDSQAKSNQSRGRQEPKTPTESENVSILKIGVDWLSE